MPLIGTDVYNEKTVTETIKNMQFTAWTVIQTHESIAAIHKHM